MPDLLSHSFAAYALGRFRGSRTAAGLVVTGTLLPDALSHVPFKILAFIKELTSVPREAYFAFAPFHTPFFLLPACALLTFFFREPIRGRAFLCLASGAALHVFLDLFQHQTDGGYLLLFPFSTRKFEFGLAWGDYWPYWLAPLLCAALLAEIAGALRGKGREVARDP